MSNYVNVGACAKQVALQVFTDAFHTGVHHLLVRVTKSILAGSNVIQYLPYEEMV